MFKNNPHSNEAANLCNSNRIIKTPLSEMHYKFQNPIIKKSPVTRAQRLEQFLWREFYEEYIRSKERLDSMPFGYQITEYNDEYGKLSANKTDLIIGEMLAKDYPVYANAAITFWNPKGQGNFGKNLSITLPISEQHGQFG